MALLVKSRGITPVSWPNSHHYGLLIIPIHLALWLSLLFPCSWCVVSAYTWLALCLSLLFPCSWCVVSAYTWLSLWLSLLSTCSWCVVSAYTWLALWLSLLSTCSWCGVSALAPLSCGSRRIIQVDAAHWWWLRRDPPPPPHMIVKRFGCTAIHIKALCKKCIIYHSYVTFVNSVEKHTVCVFFNVPVWLNTFKVK